jgi:hypothetical protein
MGSAWHVWQVVALLLLVASSVAVLLAFPLWYICKKAGFSPWLTLLNCIPLGTPVLLYLLAFAEWKRHPMFVEQPVQVGEPEPELTAAKQFASAHRPGGTKQSVTAKKPIPIRPSAR